MIKFFAKLLKTVHEKDKRRGFRPLILAILLGFLIVFSSCRTCKCPAYSEQQQNNSRTSPQEQTV